MIPVKPSYSEYTSSTVTGMSKSESLLLLLSFGFSSCTAAFSLHYTSVRVSPPTLSKSSQFLSFHLISLKS